MTLRASIQLGDISRNLTLVPILQETHEHLLLKLAAWLFYNVHEPIIVSSPQQSPALQGQDFAPDLLTVDLTNQVTLWVECGTTTSHKIEKVTKRFRDARIIMLTARRREGVQMSEMLDRDGNKRVEVRSFRDGEFDRWAKVVSEQNDIIGEASETALNLVINNEIFETELEKVRERLAD